jgi:uncharacterized membrane protein YhaH (DUF805 family)
VLWVKQNFAMIGNIYRLFFYDLFGVARRSSRKEFINRFVMMWFLTPSLLFYGKKITSVDLSILSTHFSPLTAQSIEIFFCFFLFIVFAFAMFPLVQLFYVMHRRIHDIEFSGWWQLLILSPTSPFFVLVLMLIKGTKGKNKYGDPPEF